jgi:YVTN family beta-propeller protein
MIRKTLILFYSCVVFVSCEKSPIVNDIGPLPPAKQGGIFILNEGGFNNGNASLTFYDFQKKALTDDVFFTVNSRHLGDVLQSITLYNGKAFLVLNNSKKIEIIDASTFLSKGTITGFNSPRYMLILNSLKAYVSDLYDNNIAVVDLTSNIIIKKIPCAGATEQMLCTNNKVYVTNTLQKSVYIIDPITDQLTDSISLSYGPNSIVLDTNNKVWVLCSGNQSKNINAGLYRINPMNDSVEFAIHAIAPTGIFGASKLCIDGTKKKLFWLNNDVQSFNISDTILSSTPFIRAFKNNFYGLGVDPTTNEIYVSDAIDFSQKSIVNIYSSNGSTTATFKSGINTNGFYFYY